VDYRAAWAEFLPAVQPLLPRLVMEAVADKYVCVCVRAHACVCMVIIMGCVCFEAAFMVGVFRFSHRRVCDSFSTWFRCSGCQIEECMTSSPLALRPRSNFVVKHPVFLC
jgi:hypothetical protein